MLIMMTSKYKASVIFKYYYGYGYIKGHIGYTVTLVHKSQQLPYLQDIYEIQIRVSFKR